MITSNVIDWFIVSNNLHKELDYDNDRLFNIAQFKTTQVDQCA